MQTPLTGSIAETVARPPFLLGRKGFFFDTETDGGASQGNQNPGNQDPNAQNQNQQLPATFEDPFTKAGIDLNLLDDSTRQAVVTAQQQMRDLHGRAAQASQYQSNADRLKAENDRILQQLQSSQQQHQQRQPQNEPLTFEQELEQEYLTAGLPPENAKSAAKIQSKVLGKFQERIIGVQDNRYGPVIGNVVDGNARSAFEQVYNSDQYGIIQTNPALAERLWEQTQALAKGGQLVNPEVLENFAKIFYFELKDANGTLPPAQQPPSQPPMNNGTRFTFPGAGHAVRPPAQPQDNNAAMDAETFAAMGAVTAGWPKRPKAFTNLPSASQIRITRNGV